MPSAHLSAFKSAVYCRYFPSAIFSTLGSWILRFLLGWSAWDLTHSATWVGIVAGLMLAPALVLSPLFGIVADRINPRNGLLLTIGLHALLSGMAGAAVYAGVFELPILLALALTLGVATSAHTPIRLALVPHLVPRASLPSAIGYSAIIFNTSRIIGPALGAWLLLVASPAFAYVSGAVLMFGALPFLFFVPVHVEKHAGRANASFFRELGDGVRYTRAHTTIRLVLGFTLVNALLGRTVIELLPAVSGLLLGGDSATLATLTAFAGAGSRLGGRVVSRSTLDRISGSRLGQLSRQLAKRGTIAVAVLRLIPIAPFAGFNLVAGASRLGFRQFMVGSLLGAGPGSGRDYVLLGHPLDGGQ